MFSLTNVVLFILWVLFWSTCFAWMAKAVVRSFQTRPMIKMHYLSVEGLVEYDREHKEYYGRLNLKGDLVTFGAKTLIDIRREFRSAVDDYLLLCDELERSPQNRF